MSDEMYPIGYDQAVVEIMQKRTAVKTAEFLLPYLKPDMKLLDCGCGAGSITIGLAKWLPQGSVTGIDIEASVLEIAKKLSLEKGVDNASFQQGNVYQLPFENNSFDVVFCNALLCHERSMSEQALEEMKRVLKPGGIIAISEPYLDKRIIYPEDSKVNFLYELQKSACIKMGADYDLGPSLRGILDDHGFSKVTATASFETYGNYEELSDVVAYAKAALINSPWVELALEEGILSEVGIEEIQKALEAFKRNPKAFIAIPWCNVVGFLHSNFDRK